MKIQLDYAAEKNGTGLYKVLGACPVARISRALDALPTSLEEQNKGYSHEFRFSVRGPETNFERHTVTLYCRDGRWRIGCRNSGRIAADAVIDALANLGLDFE